MERLTVDELRALVLEHLPDGEQLVDDLIEAVRRAEQGYSDEPDPYPARAKLPASATTVNIPRFSALTDMEQLSREVGVTEAHIAQARADLGYPPASSDTT